jgi:anti-sigma factor ChrR (cupin superfamily)
MSREKREHEGMMGGGGSRPAHPSDQSRETAALFALGALSKEEADAFEAHLAEGCPACAADARAFREVTAEMERAFAPAGPGGVEPPPRLREQLLGRIAAERGSAAAGAERAAGTPADHETQVWKRWQASPGSFIAPGLFTLRADQGGWEDTAVPGVAVKPLFVDSVRSYVSMLVRMAPGSSYPCHRHGGAEECFVLEGDLRVAGHVLHAGDYQRAEEDSDHGEQSTENGCLLLIVSSQHDELN